MLWPVPIRHYLNVIGSLGLDGRDILAGTGIEATALEDAKYRVTLEQYRFVLENMARLGADQGLGLDIGLAFTIPKLGPLGYAALSCGTPRQSMEEFWSRYGEMLGVLGHPVFIADDERTSTIQIATPSLSDAAYRFCVEEALCLMIHVGQMVAGRRPAFEKIEFAFPRPQYHERYRRLFRCPASFDAPQTRVMLKRGWVEQPLSSQNEGLRDFYQQHLFTLRRQAKRNSSVAGLVRDRLLHHDQGQLPSLAAVAQELGLTERTLCRKLQKEGLNYRKLVEEFRHQQALRLVRANDATTAEISRRLGFRDINAFRRAFKKWTGQTVCRFGRTD